MSVVELLVPDMSCGHCAATIREAVQAVDAAGRCEVDLEAKRVRVESAQPPEKFLAAIAKAGFAPTLAAR